MQRKVFRVEQMFAGKRACAPAAEPPRLGATRKLNEPRQAPPDAAAQTLQRELAAIRDAIARNKHELDALIVEGKERRMARAAGELDAAVDGMEKATVKILKSSELIDDCAKALVAGLKSDYERGLAQDIQEQVVVIYEACNFQDLAGQRIEKVIATLNAIEQKVAAMLECSTIAASPANTRTAPKPAPGRALVNGPKLDDDTGHASQIDIDSMFA